MTSSSSAEMLRLADSRRARLGSLAAVVSFALTVCASFPPTPPAPEPKQSTAYAAERSLAASSADWPATDWWRDYGDPQLDGLITGALAGAPGLKEAQARLHRAVAGTAAARAAGLLSLTASGGVADAKQSHYQGFPPEFVTDPGITIEIGAEVSALHGTDHLEAVTVRDVKTGATREVKTRALFIMVGAAPNTGWLSDLVKLDEKGYVLTGSGPESASSPFATSMPGIFAVFDVRAGSVKRVDSSVGERSVVISKVWEHVNG